MFQNYFKVALRNLVKHKVQSFLSVFGLMIGIGVTVLIILFVQDEFTYDAYHGKANRIYRLVNNWKGGDEVTPWARTATPMGPAIKETFPQVQQVVRIRKNPRTDLIEFEDKKFYEKRLVFADQEVFEVFDFPLLRGNPETVLKDKYTILLTEKIARKYFGNEDPVGKILTYDNKHPLKVTGILGEIPANSHFHFDLMADFETAKEVLGEQQYKNWFWFDIQTYILINNGEKGSPLEGKLNDIIEKNVPEKYAPLFDLVLQPLTSIHLESNLKDELEKNSDVKYSYIMLTVAVFIILMACINFMNLTTANYSTRLTEIGLRKVFGAQKASWSDNILQNRSS